MHVRKWAVPMQDASKGDFADPDMQVRPMGGHELICTFVIPNTHTRPPTACESRLRTNLRVASLVQPQNGSATPGIHGPNPMDYDSFTSHQSSLLDG